MNELRIPALTYQYCDEGELDEDSFVPFQIGQDPRKITRDSIKSQDRWDRLVELVAEQYRDLPDNEIIQQRAYLVGLTDVIPPRINRLMNPPQRQSFESPKGYLKETGEGYVWVESQADGSIKIRR
ncbi:MAG: hypothetical protein ACRD5H_00025 [Nitrososphaerales archaeon]